MDFGPPVTLSARLPDHDGSLVYLDENHQLFLIPPACRSSPASFNFCNSKGDIKGGLDFFDTIRGTEHVLSAAHSMLSEYHVHSFT